VWGCAGETPENGTIISIIVISLEVPSTGAMPAPPHEGRRKDGRGGASKGEMPCTEQEMASGSARCRSREAARCGPAVCVLKGGVCRGEAAAPQRVREDQPDPGRAG